MYTTLRQMAANAIIIRSYHSNKGSALCAIWNIKVHVLSYILWSALAISLPVDMQEWACPLAHFLGPQFSVSI